MSDNRIINILIAEDNTINQKVLKLTLEREGFNIRIAENGQEAVEMYEAEHFDMIFMDVHMPLMDGLEATRLIRANEPEEERIPIVALTATIAQDEIHLCSQSGMDAYLTKSFDKEVLLETIFSYVKSEEVPS